MWITQSTTSAMVFYEKDAAQVMEVGDNGGYWQHGRHRVRSRE
jgi:hypothetical protein